MDSGPLPSYYRQDLNKEQYNHSYHFTSMVIN